jgi:hypothetical protein
MDHGRTHVKAWLFWVDEKVKQEKKTYAAAPDFVGEERKKKEKKESKVKLKTEQIEKTWTRKTGEEKIKKIANSEAKVRKGTWSQRQNIYIDSVQ